MKASHWLETESDTLGNYSVSPPHQVSGASAALDSTLKVVGINAFSGVFPEQSPLRRPVTGSVVNTTDDFKNMLQFHGLFDAIEYMGNQPEGAEQAIDEETKSDAEDFLGFIRLYDIPPPKIFSHGGDAVVFTWETVKLRRYITVSAGCVAVMLVDKATRLECSYPYVEMKTRQLDTWMLRLNAPEPEIDHVEQY